MLVCLLALIVGLSDTADANDARQLVQLPEKMRVHLLRNMRDHLKALEEITRHLATGHYEQASGIAENRLGLSSLDAHGASHMAEYFPPGMAQTGVNMHRAASRFAIAARDAELEGSLETANSALSEVIAQCVACHENYRVH
jgi:hypothetical protein